MKRLVRLTERDLTRIVKRVIMEQETINNGEPDNRTDDEIRNYARLIDSIVNKFVDMYADPYMRDFMKKRGLNFVKGEYVDQLDIFFENNGFMNGYSDAQPKDYEEYKSQFDKLNSTDGWKH